MKVIHADKWDKKSDGVEYALVNIDGIDYHRHTKIVDNEPYDHYKETFKEGLVNGFFVTSGYPRAQAKKISLIVFEQMEVKNDASEKCSV